MPTEDSNSISTSPGRFRVIAAQVIFRHGARTPIYEFPEARGRLKKMDWGGEEMCGEIPESQFAIDVCYLNGQPIDEAKPTLEQTLEERKTETEFQRRMRPGKITRGGQECVVHLGERLRQRYVTEEGLISPSYDASEVYCRSTHVDRTLLSMKCLLSGLFPQIKDREEPVKVYTSEPHEETLVAYRYKSKILPQASDLKVLKSPALISDLRREIDQILGENALSIVSDGENGSIKMDFPLVFIYDNLVARKYEGESLPPDCEYLLEELIKVCPEEHCLMSIYVNVGSDEKSRSVAMRAAMGPACDLLLTNLRLQKSKSTQRLLLFAAHDEILILLLTAFKLFDGRWPQFGETLSFELLEAENGDLWTRIVYGDRVLKVSTFEEMEKFLIRFAITKEECTKLCVPETNTRL